MEEGYENDYSKKSNSNDKPYESSYKHPADSNKGIAHETPSQEIADIDRELEELLKKQNAKIKVVGIGGGGNNTLSRIHEIGIKGGEMNEIDELKNKYRKEVRSLICELITELICNKIPTNQKEKRLYLTDIEIKYNEKIADEVKEEKREIEK